MGAFNYFSRGFAVPQFNITDAEAGTHRVNNTGGLATAGSGGATHWFGYKLNGMSRHECLSISLGRDCSFVMQGVRL